MNDDIRTLLERIEELENENKKLKSIINSSNVNLKDEISVKKVEPMRNEKGEFTSFDARYKYLTGEEVYEDVKEKNIGTKKRDAFEDVNKSKIDVKNYQDEKNEFDTEKRNIILLVSGAIFIVLAALVFILSSWHNFSNNLKSGILIVLIGFFMGISRFFKQKLHLEKASKTFFYLALAYIPICFFSLSFLTLLGNYLSYNGEGKWIYFACSSLVTSIIYYIVDLKEKNCMKYFSIMFQYISVVCYVLIFSNSLYVICLVLLAYNAILCLFGEKIEIEIYDLCYYIIPSCATLIGIFNIMDNSFFPLLIFLCALINFIILYQKNGEEFFANFGLCIIQLFIGVYWCCGTRISQWGIYRELGALIYPLITSIIYYYLSRDNAKLKTLINFSMILLNIISAIIFGRESFMYLATWISNLLILLLDYFEDSYLDKKIIYYLISIDIYQIILKVGIFYELTYNYYIISGIMGVVVFSIINYFKNYEFVNTFGVIAHIALLIVYLVEFLEIKEVVYYYVILFLIYCYSLYKFKTIVFKYLLTLSSYFLLFSIFLLCKVVDYFNIIPTIVFLGTMVIKKLINKVEVREDSEEIYICISEMIACVACLFNINTISFISINLLSIYLLFYYFEKEEIIYIEVIRYLCLAIVCKAYFDDALVTDLLLMGWFFAVYKTNRKQVVKHISLTLSYLLCILMVRNGLSYLNIDYNLDFVYLWTATIIVGRNVLVHYISKEDYNLVIFILLVLVLLVSIVNIDSLFIINMFLICMVIFSYYQKYGIEFIANVSALIISMFYATRVFWFSIPWWIYLLVFGSILISIAVKGEAGEKKEKIGNIVNNIIDKIEK